VGSDSKNGVRHQRALSPRLSMMICLSVRLFVRPSHGWISEKRFKLWVPNFHRRLRRTIVVIQID